MTELQPSVQRSFRLSQNTSALLDALAEHSVESRNSLVERLLAEALRTERHPLVRFQLGASGRREPMLIGTRLKVRQVVTTVKASGNDVDEVATSLDIPVRAVRAAMSYYAEFGAEIDEDSAWAARFEATEQARWEREQAAFA
jgi:uncharacterized protein (DUF433 family)